MKHLKLIHCQSSKHIISSSVPDQMNLQAAFRTSNERCYQLLKNWDTNAAKNQRTRQFHTAVDQDNAKMVEQFFPYVSARCQRDAVKRSLAQNNYKASECLIKNGVDINFTHIKIKALLANTSILFGIFIGLYVFLMLHFISPTMIQETFNLGHEPFFALLSSIIFLAGGLSMLPFLLAPFLWQGYQARVIRKNMLKRHEQILLSKN